MEGSAGVIGDTQRSTSTVQRLLAQRDDALHRLLALAGDDGEGLLSNTSKRRRSEKMQSRNRSDESSRLTIQAEPESLKNQRQSARKQTPPQHSESSRSAGTQSEQKAPKARTKYPRTKRTEGAAGAEYCSKGGRSLFESLSPEERAELLDFIMISMKDKFAEKKDAELPKFTLESLSPEDKAELMDFVMTKLKEKFAEEKKSQLDLLMTTVEEKFAEEKLSQQAQLEFFMTHLKEEFADDEESRLLLSLPPIREQAPPLLLEALLDDQQNALGSPPSREQASPLASTARLDDQQNSFSGMGTYSALLRPLEDSVSLEASMPKDREDFIAFVGSIKNQKRPSLGSLDGHSMGTVEKEREEWHSPFNESTYTMLYMCKFQSQAFWYALFIYFLQIATILLTLVDTIDFNGNGNSLRLPPMVDLTVTCSQAVTLFLALAYQSDLIEAVLKLKDGFYPEVLERHAGATYGTWLFANVAQLAAGMLLLTTIFVLTMQSSDVLSIMLNFAALHFMSDIDDLGFLIAKFGFVTNKLQLEAMEVIGFEVPKRPQKYCFRRVLYVITLVGLFLGYAWLKSFQLSGRYLQTNVYVQFGDTYNQKIPFYSGILSSANARTTYQRQYKNDVGTQKILLAYCNKEISWTFSETGDPCNFLAKSYETYSYDVTSIPASEWQVKDGFGRLKPFQSFSLVGRDCKPEICKGECVDGLCNCPPNRFGLDCEFDNVCKDIVGNGNYPHFPPVDGYKVSDEFHMLENMATGNNVRVYNMPVYYSNKTYPANIIFFGGRRWILTDEADFFNMTELEAENPLTKYFPQKTAELLADAFFHGYESTYIPSFLSDPVDFETPEFLPTPAGLGWSTVSAADESLRLYAPSIPLGTVLTCTSCLAEHGGTCDSVGGVCNQTTGLCDCNANYGGAKCENQKPCYLMEIPCWGDGVCDKNDGKCRCNLPWYGKLCEFGFSCYEEYGDCLHDGVCNITSGSCDCSADPATAGFACEKRKDCRIFGCENVGSCDELTGLCSCSDPYDGVLCSLSSNSTEVLSLDCGANGTACSASADFLPCVDDEGCGGASFCNFDTDNMDSASGVCTPVNKTDCRELGCSKRGFCNPAGFCECENPFSGPRCDYVVENIKGR